MDNVMDDILTVVEDCDKEIRQHKEDITRGVRRHSEMSLDEFVKANPQSEGVRLREDVEHGVEMFSSTSCPNAHYVVNRITDKVYECYGCSAWGVLDEERNSNKEVAGDLWVNISPMGREGWQLLRMQKGLIKGILSEAEDKSASPKTISRLKEMIDFIGRIQDSAIEDANVSPRRVLG